MAPSVVWRYFEVGRAEDGCKLGPCRLCDIPPVLRCADNSTSCLWAHLKTKHKEQHRKILRNTEGVAAAVKSPSLRQPTIQSLLTSRAPYGLRHPKQLEFDKNIKQQFINDCVPFSMADSSHFRKTVADLDPRIKVKTAKTYSKYLRSDEQKVKKSVKRLVKKKAAGLVGLTADMWDDRKGNSFCSLTAHYVDDDFNLIRATPSIKFFGTGRHTSENIAEVLGTEIESVKNEGNLVVLATDSTNNMKKARRLLQASGIIDEEVGCVNHKFQNSVKAAIKASKEVKRIIAKAKKLSKHIKKSSLGKNRLVAACGKTGHQFKKIKSCVDIRWNSEHDCLQSLLYHQECLEEMDRNRHLEKVSNFILTRQEWRMLEPII